MRLYINSVLLLFLILVNISCFRSAEEADNTSSENKPEIVIKKRDDGTISSINQVVDGRIVHGIRTTYYQDGRTIYSKQTFDYGVKQGPATWYYMNGALFKQTNFKDGKRQGLTRVYYKNGNLLAEFESEKGIVRPGLKEYTIDGELITSYPGVEFREIDHLASKNRVDLEISCTKRRSGVKFYILKEENGIMDRVYLITENDRALLQFYVKPGEVLQRKVYILAEMPTELGNLLTKTYSYQLSLAN